MIHQPELRPTSRPLPGDHGDSKESKEREFKMRKLVGFSGGDLSRLGLLGWLKARWVRSRSYQPTHAISGVYPCKKIYFFKGNQHQKLISIP